MIDDDEIRIITIAVVIVIVTVIQGQDPEVAPDHETKGGQEMIENNVETVEIDIITAVAIEIVTVIPDQEVVHGTTESQRTIAIIDEIVEIEMIIITMIVTKIIEGVGIVGETKEVVIIKTEVDKISVVLLHRYSLIATTKTHHNMKSKNIFVKNQN